MGTYAAAGRGKDGYTVTGVIITLSREWVEWRSWEAEERLPRSGRPLHAGTESGATLLGGSLASVLQCRDGRVGGTAPPPEKRGTQVGVAAGRAVRLARAARTTSAKASCGARTWAPARFHLRGSGCDPLGALGLGRQRTAPAWPMLVEGNSVFGGAWPRCPFPRLYGCCRLRQDGNRTGN